MGLFEVTLTGTYFNQQIVNRWNYVGSGTPVTTNMATALAEAFGAVPTDDVYPSDTILDLIAALVCDDYSMQQLVIFDVYDPTQFVQAPFVPAYTGRESGQPMSPTMAYGFRSNQVRRDIRRATKRLVGVSEAQVGDGGLVGVPALGGMVLLCTEMGRTLTVEDSGATLSFVPAVVKKQRYNPITGLASSTGTAYRYIPEDDGGETAQLAQTAQGISWQPYDSVRTQTSRQYGHGR